MKNQCAFTLIEIIIVLAIISVLSMIAIPGLQTLLRKAQDDAAQADILRMVEIARSEALLLRQTVTLCKSRDQRTCSGEWSEGQIVFVDPVQDGVVRDRSQVIAVNKMKNKGGDLRARFYPRYREFIQFNSMLAENDDNGTFWLCHVGSALPVWAIKISKSGSAHVLLPDRNGEIKDKAGRVMMC